MSAALQPLARPTMSATLIAKLCRERAEQYGALRASSPTAVALDQAAALIETTIMPQQARQGASR